MNIYAHRQFLGTFLFLLLLFLPLWAQETENEPTAKFQFEPDSLYLDVGDTVTVSIKLVEQTGALRETPFILFSRGPQAGRAVEVLPRRSGSTGSVDATVIAHRPGSFKLTVRTITVSKKEKQIKGDIGVGVAYPPLHEVKFVNPREQLYAHTTVAYQTEVLDAAGLERNGLDVSLASNNPDIASFDGFGNLTTHRPGIATLIAQVEGLRATTDIKVIENPVVALELRTEVREARTGDVIQFDAVARDGLGQAVEDLPIDFALMAKETEKLDAPASGEIDQKGRFVAETPGIYTILVRSGLFVQALTVRIKPREVKKKIELVGHGPVLDVFTSDLWVWEGLDGRDYAATGTWRANGEAYFWDVTDPAKMKIIDTVKVDARTVNDIKVSEDGRIAVISREGASNRRNGIVVLDVSSPHDVKVLSRFDDGLTGGVHNVFIYNNHVYAVNNGRRYDIINIEDPRHPYRVGRFELSTPGHGLHDVWIENGVAYSSNWQDGIQLVDVGGVTSRSPFRQLGDRISPEIVDTSTMAGSPKNPFQFASYEYPSGWNHAAFPYFSESTRKFYVLAGDEAFPYGDGTTQATPVPTVAAGWIHFIDFTDLSNPAEVARYEVPEAGSHNFWIEGDTLYAAFYNGGFRVVDISGDLKGDLYRQGREVGWFLPQHPKAIVPNAAMVWGAQPHKGVIFLSDHHSGLWAVRLAEHGKKKQSTP